MQKVHLVLNLVLFSFISLCTLGQTVPDTFEVTLKTTVNDKASDPIVIKVTKAWSPLGAERFWNMTRPGVDFLGGAGFFRVVPGFMVQFGLPADPDRNSEFPSFKDDPSAGIFNTRGYVTFAKTSAPDSRTTQLFINYANNSFLDDQGFTPFGQVVSGMTTVDNIYAGYKESPSQGAIVAQGNEYLLNNFPLLDYILYENGEAPKLPPTPPPTPAPPTPPPTSGAGVVRLNYVGLMIVLVLCWGL